MREEEEFFDGLPLYARVLFTFAIITVSFAVIWFIYRKIVKPRIILKQHLYSKHSDTDSEHADLKGARSPMTGPGSRRGEYYEDEEDEWGGGADSHHSSGHTPVLIRQTRRTPLSARYEGRGRHFRTPLGSSVPFSSIGQPNLSGHAEGDGANDGAGDTSGVFHSEDFEETDGFQHYGY